MDNVGTLVGADVAVGAGRSVGARVDVTVGGGVRVGSGGGVSSGAGVVVEIEGAQALKASTIKSRVRSFRMNGIILHTANEFAAGTIFEKLIRACVILRRAFCAEESLASIRNTADKARDASLCSA